MGIKIFYLAHVKRFIASAISLVYFYTNVMAVHSGEKNFWAERRTASQQMRVGDTNKEPGTLSGKQNPHGLGSEQYLALAPLPQMGHVEFGGPQSASVGTGLSLAPNVSDLQSMPTPPSWISKLILPYGSIAEIHLSKKLNAPLVIHIQDAHGIEEAQKNIASMILGLKESQGVNLVGLEGASGAFDLDSFRGPDLSVARDLADYFLKEGKIAGPEYAGLTAPHPPALYGVEDLPLYVSNVRALLDARKEKPAMDKTLADLNSAVEALKTSTYSEELKEYDRHLQAYEDQKEGLADYVRYLVHAHREDQKKFPNIGLLIKALAAEKSLDFKRVEKERLALVEMLAGGLSKTKLNLLVERSLQYRAGQMGYGDYHRFLLGLCRENKIPFEKLSEMKAYIDYVLLAEQINRNALLDELIQLEQETQDRLAVTEEQKKLVSVTRRLGLLSKLAAQAMTASDWAIYESRKEDVYRLVLDIKGLGGKTDANISPDLLAPFESFCLNAIQRNNAFVQNLADQIKTQKVSSAILVAGGFHTQGLTGLLRENDFSYVVATPKITEVPKNDNYLDVFARDPLPLEKLFMGEKVFLKFPAPMGPEMTGVDNGRREGFVNEALAIGAAVSIYRHPAEVRYIEDTNKRAKNLGSLLEVGQFDSGIIADVNGDGEPDATVLTRGPHEQEPSDFAQSLGTRLIGETSVTFYRPRLTFASRVRRAFTGANRGSPQRRSRPNTGTAQSGRSNNETSRLRAFAAIPYDAMRRFGWTEHEWVTKVMPRRETVALAIVSPLLVSILMFIGFSTLWIIALFAAIIAGLNFASVHKFLWEKNGDVVSVKNYFVWAVGGTIFALPFTFFWAGLFTGALPFIGFLDFSQILGSSFTWLTQVLIYFSVAFSLSLSPHVFINKLIQEERINNRFLSWLLEKPFAAETQERENKKDALEYVNGIKLTPFNQQLMVRTGKGMYATMALSKAEATQGINEGFIVLKDGELRFVEGRTYQDIPAFSISDGLGNTRVVTFGDLKYDGVRIWSASRSVERTQQLKQLAHTFLPKAGTPFNFNGTIWFFTSAEVDVNHSTADHIRFSYLFANAVSGIRTHQRINTGTAAPMTDEEFAQFNRDAFEERTKYRLEKVVKNVGSFEIEDNLRSDDILKELREMKTNADLAHHSAISEEIDGLIQRVQRAQIRYSTEREIRESFKKQVSIIGMSDLANRGLSHLKKEEDLANFQKSLKAWWEGLQKREKPEAMTSDDFAALIQLVQNQVSSIRGKIDDRRTELFQARYAHERRFHELDHPPAPALVLKRLGTREIYSHVYEKNGPLVFVLEIEGKQVFFRVRKQRSTGNFELSFVQLTVENQAFNPHLLVFENVRTVNIISPPQTIQFGHRQIQININKDGTHTINLMDQGSSHGTEIVMDKLVKTAEDLRLPASLEDWHRVEAILETVGRSIVGRTNPAYDRGAYVKRLAELVDSWTGLPDALRSPLLNNLYSSRGWVPSGQQVTQHERLLASEWLRRFFRLYHHVFYLTPAAVLSGGQKGLILFGRVSHYRDVGWRGFRTITYVDPLFTNAKGGFKPMLNDDEVLVLNDDLQVHKDLIALHEARHMFDRMEYSQYGLSEVSAPIAAQEQRQFDPEGLLTRAGVQPWELEYTAYLITLVKAARANQKADGAGQKHPHTFLEAVAGNSEDIFERYVQMGESREEHARALKELWSLMRGFVLGQAAPLGIELPPSPSGQQTPKEILEEIKLFEARVPPTIMADVAESMLTDFYMKKLGYVPQYPDVLEATVVPVSWPSPRPLWQTNAGFHQYLSALESDSERLKLSLASLSDFSRTGQASPSQLVRIFAFLVQFPKETIETREDLDALTDQIRHLDSVFWSRIFTNRSGYENFPRYLAHIGIGQVVMQGAQDFLKVYDQKRDVFVDSIARRAVPVPHVPLIEPVNTQIVRATHSGTEMRGSQLFTAGIGLLLGSVLALVLGEVVSLTLAAVVVVSGGVFHIGLKRNWSWVISFVDGFTSVVLAGVLERPDLMTGTGRNALVNRHNNSEQDRAVLLKVFRRSMGLEKLARRRADRMAQRINDLNVPSAVKPLMIATAKTINVAGDATGLVLNVAYHSFNNLVAIAVEKKWMTEARALALLGRRPVMAHAVSKPKENSSRTMDGTAGARGLYNLAGGYVDTFSEDFIYSTKYRVIFFLARHLPTQGLRDKWLSFVLKKYEKEVPGTIGYISVRSQQIDETVKKFASENQKNIQVVELAAGLSARAYRLKNIIGDGPHFEFDLPASQNVKTKLLEKNQKSKPELYPNHLVKHLSGNLTADDFMDQLVDNGLDAGKPTIFILEGLTMYLTKEKVQNIFATIKARAPPGSLVIADFLYPTDEIDGKRGGKELSEFVTKHGEPFKYGQSPETLKAEFESNGFVGVTVFSNDEFSKVLASSEANGRLTMAGFFYMVTMTVPGGRKSTSRDMGDVGLIAGDGNERIGVPAPDGLPQTVTLQELQTLVGDSRPVIGDPRFQGYVGPSQEAGWAEMESYLNNLNISGDESKGKTAVSSLAEKNLTHEFVRALQTASVGDVASYLLTLAKDMATSEQFRTDQNRDALFGGVALLHAKNSALLAQANNGTVPTKLADLREAQAHDIHLLVQVAALTGIKEAGELTDLFFRYYDETMKKAETLTRFEAKGAEDANRDAGALLTVNLNGLQESDIPGDIAYIIGAAKARMISEGAAPVAVTSLLSIDQLIAMNPALRDVASQVVAVTPSKAKGLFNGDGKLSINALVTYMKSQRKSVTSLDVVSPGKDSVIEDQEDGVTVIIRDYYSLIRAIADGMKGMVFVLLQA